MKIFVSYSHVQKDWVRQRLVPCLEAGGAEVLIDLSMEVGKRVIGEMDRFQDEAQLSVLVLTPEYLASAYCRHEMDRAVARDQFVPVIRHDCTAFPDHIHVDLRDDNNTSQWDKLMSRCEAALDAPVPDWLRARDEIVELLQRGDSVNLVVEGLPKWRELTRHLRACYFPDAKIIDLEDPATIKRAGLVRRMLTDFGLNVAKLTPSSDLQNLPDMVAGGKRMLFFEHFDRVETRNYGPDFYSALRFYMNERKLEMLVESRKPLVALQPELSHFNFAVVRLKGR